MKILVDRTEYEALCDLRDGAHERLRIQVEQAKEHYRALRVVTGQQADRLLRQEDELQALRGVLRATEARLREAEKWRPLTSSVEQPLFAKEKR